MKPEFSRTRETRGKNRERGQTMTLVLLVLGLFLLGAVGLSVIALYLPMFNVINLIK